MPRIILEKAFTTPNYAAGVLTVDYTTHSNSTDYKCMSVSPSGDVTSWVFTGADEGDSFTLFVNNTSGGDIDVNFPTSQFRGNSGISLVNTIPNTEVLQIEAILFGGFWRVFAANVSTVPS